MIAVYASKKARGRAARSITAWTMLVGLGSGCGDDSIQATSDTASGTTEDATTSGTTTAATTTTTTTTTITGTASESDSASGTTTTTTTTTSSTSTTSETSTTTMGSTTAVSTTDTTSDTTTDSTTTGVMPECQGPDEDNDTVPDECDVCPGGDDLADADGDTVPDACDACPLGDDAADVDMDGVADACDPCPADNPDDTDNDGVCDSDDLCDKGDDNVDVDQDGIPDACDPEVSVEIMGPLYDFDTANDGSLVLSRYNNGAVYVTCYNADLSVRKAEFQVGTYDLEPAPGPGPTVNIARASQKVIVAWHDPSGVNIPPRMEYTYLDDQCDVLVAEATALTGIDYMEYHSTAIDEVGNAVIAASRAQTRIAFIDSAGQLKGEQTAFTLNGTAYGTHVAMNQTTGEGVLSAQPHSGGTLYYRRFNADGTWKDAAVVPVSINNHAWYDGHTVGMNDKGQFLLLWRSSGTQLDFRIFDADGSVLANVQRPTADYDNGTPYDAFRRRHSEIQLRGDNFVLGEAFRNTAPEVMHFEYTPAGVMITEDSTPITVAMVLAIRVTPGGRTYLHDGNTVTLGYNYP